MKMRRKSDGAIFTVAAPKVIPSKEDMVKNDVTACFVELENPEVGQDKILVVYAPFAEKQDYELLTEEEGEIL